MGCSSCKKAQDYDTAKNLAAKIAQVWQSDVIIFKQFIHGVGYTYGYQRSDEPVAKRCEQIEVVRFQQYKSKEILSDTIGEESTIVEQETVIGRKNNRKSSKATTGTMGSDSGEV